MKATVDIPATRHKTLYKQVAGIGYITMKISDLFEMKPQTIASATDNGHLSMAKSQYITDPRGFFQKNKKKLKKARKTTQP